MSTDREITRRTFIHAAAGGAMLAAADGASALPNAAAPAKRRFLLNLNVGNIGVKADPFEAIRLARQYGYESVTPMPPALGRFSTVEMQRLVSSLKEAGLKWGSAGISPFFEPDEARLAPQIKEITATAVLLQRLGADRCMTWTLSSSSALTYRENWRLHVRRVREVGKVLADRGVRLGIEYIGTKMVSWKGKYPFLRTLAEMRELMAEVGLANVGVVLDTWHWWQAGDTAEDVLKLAPQQVISVDLCDAPTGAPREQLPDSPRCLPCSTGVIDIRSFLESLVKIGYAGPVGAEPFDKSLSQLPTDQAMTKATAAVKRAVALVEAA
jgi:sugar phosphate isomerase/epimerase